MQSHFSSQFFINNRRKIKQQFKSNTPIIVAANGLLQRGADSTYAFSQDANFWYLTGIDEPDLILVMDDKDDYLIVPGRSGVRETFDGSVPVDIITKRSGVKTIFDDIEGWEKLEGRLSKVAQAAIVMPPPAYVEQYGFYTNPARIELANKLEKRSNSLEIIDAGQELALLRMVKELPEISAIQAAIDITCGSLLSATKNLKQYTYEYELEAQIRAGFRSRGASGDSFEPIVASGKNACTLHNVANNDKLVKSGLVLCDVGAEVEHYAADITRNYALGKPTSRQLDVHAAVTEVQQFAFSILKPGMLMRDYEQSIEDFMGEKLKQLKLIKTINHDNVRKYYPHSTSHFMGLNVHDVGDYRQPLQVGVVMTVEPGIYISDESIGVRIEDDILLTTNGPKILSDKLPKSIS
jgi:Xaa-Pro aminopeptidase